MGQQWTSATIRYLSDPTVCPRCDQRFAGGACAICGLDVRGETGAALWRASQEVADAVRRRQEIVDAAPSLATPAANPVPERAKRVEGHPTPVPTPAPPYAPPPGWTPAAPHPASLAAAPLPVDTAAAPPRRSEWSVQSLLAVAGAGLVAVAAVVFALFNPDVQDPAVRLSIIGGVTVLFVAVALLTARRLRLTAESLAALSAVFLGLDVLLLADLVPDGAMQRLAAGLGLLVAGALMLALGALTRLRGWLFPASLALGSFAPLLASSLDDGGITRFGVVAVGAVAIVGHLVLDRVSVARGKPIVAERVAFTIAQLLWLAPLVGAFFDVIDDQWSVLLLTAGQVVLAALLGLVTARWIMPRGWSVIAGVLLVVAALYAGWAVEALRDTAWSVPILATAVAVMLVLIAVTTRLGLWCRVPFDGVRPALLRTGAAVAALVALGPFLVFGGIAAIVIGLIGDAEAIGGLEAQPAIAAAAGALVAGMLLARVVDRPAGERVLAGPGVLAPWLLVFAVPAATLWAGFDRPLQAGVSIAVAATVAVLARIPGPRAWLGLAGRIPVAVLAHLLLLFALIVGALDDRITEIVGIAVVAALVLVARLVPSPERALHWGAGNAIVLGVVAVALGRTELEAIDRLAIVAAAGALIALVATLVRPLPRGAWWAILIVTTVPFLLAVGSVLVERTGWTALSTGAMAALALVLTLSRRPGLGVGLRVTAAALVLPSIAVSVVCLGAELLVTSGSPVVLPIIAVLVAGVFASSSWIEAGLRRAGVEAPRAIAIAVEASAGVTGAIAVLLALVRVASGFDTAMIVLLIVGVGAAVARVVGGRRWGWWVAAASWTGALWCALLLVEVDVVEPYVLPPALAAAIIGVIGLVRGRSGRAPAALTIAGIGAGVLSTLVALAISGSGNLWVLWLGLPVSWRAIGLAVAAIAFLSIATGLREAPPRLRVLRTALLVATIVAAAGPAVQAVRWGAGADGIPDWIVPIGLVLPTALVGTLLAGLGARSLAGSMPAGEGVFDRRRWLGAPAVAMAVVGPVVATRSDWITIWTLWGLMAALFAVAIVAAALTVRGRTLLPPVWLISLAGWVAAVGGWSQRELRVEVFSLPMGLAVLTMGAVHLAAHRGERARAASLNAWPAGFAGSWWLLAPGLVLVLLPSVLSTGTDPVTWRASMVIGIAIVAILVGSVGKLAAPFFIGLVTLPIENIVVFAVQIGRGVESLPWWITLATAGAILLAIAMNSEWRSKSGAKVSRISEMR